MHLLKFIGAKVVIFNNTSSTMTKTYNENENQVQL